MNSAFFLQQYQYPTLSASAHPMGTAAQIPRTPIIGIPDRPYARSIDSAFLTLHAGLGNFREIDVEDLTKHKTDSEQMIVDKPVCDLVNRAKQEERRICAIGTTVVRALETAVSTAGTLKEYEGWTNKFIFPPYEFNVANAMVSNFHMPLSTLLMVVTAFGGFELIMDAYHLALKEDYKFGCYGDAMLIID